MALAGDVVFVAGAPAFFPPDNPVESYEAAYEGRRGGLLWAASATLGVACGAWNHSANGAGLGESSPRPAKNPASIASKSTRFRSKAGIAQVHVPPPLRSLRCLGSRGLGALRLRAAVPRGRRPNFIFLLGDDLAQSEVGCYGNPLIQTPSIDRMAAEGVLFENAFVTTSICAPNRACILAGQHQRTTGIKDFAKPFTPEQIDRTYPLLLKQAGYRIGFIGKWGVGASARNLALPASRFDYWQGFPGQGSYWYEIDGEKRHEVDVVPMRTREFLEGRLADQPFCLSISFKAPHGPYEWAPAFDDLYTGESLPPLPPTCTREAYEALPEFLRNSLNGKSLKLGPDGWVPERNLEGMRGKIAGAWRMVTGLDLCVGRIRETLREKGLADNTILILTGDNGYFHFERGLTGKWLMYEPSIRVPLILYDPRAPQSQRGRRLEPMALTIDVAPTILSLASLSADPGMQGMSLMRLLDNPQAPWREDWFYEHTYETNPKKPSIAKSEGVRTERWKYIRYLDMTPHVEELYDLQADPQELRNLAADPECRDVLEDLRKRYQQYRKDLLDNAPDPGEYSQDGNA